MSTGPPALSLREVFRLKGIRHLGVAQLVSVFGDFLAIFAVFSVASFRMHASATAISGILIAYLLPLAIAGPVAGVFVDRWNVKKTMIASDLIRSALALALIFTSNLYQVYGILFALSTVSSFFLPAQSVTLRTLVPKEGLMSANAFFSQIYQGMQIVSPAASGALVAWFGASSCFWLDSLTFVFSAAVIFTIAIPRERVTGARNLASVLSEMNAGVKFMFTHSALSLVILCMMAGMFAIRCFSALIAVYVRDVLHGASVLFGVLGSLIGVGMIIGTQLLHRLGKGKSKSHMVVFGLLGIGVSIFVLATFGTIPTTALGSLGIGFAVAFVVIPAQTLLQEETPAPMLGRVSSSMVSALAISQVAGLAVAGRVAQFTGIRNLYFAAAGLLVLISLIGYTKLRDPATAQVAVEPGR